MTKDQLEASGFKPVETAPQGTQIEVAHARCADEVLIGRLHSDGWELEGGFVVDGEDAEPTHWRPRIILDEYHQLFPLTEASNKGADS